MAGLSSLNAFPTEIKEEAKKLSALLHRRGFATHEGVATYNGLCELAYRHMESVEPFLAQLPPEYQKPTRKLISLLPLPDRSFSSYLHTTTISIAIGKIALEVHRFYEMNLDQPIAWRTIADVVSDIDPDSRFEIIIHSLAPNGKIQTIHEALDLQILDRMRLDMPTLIRPASEVTELIADRFSGPKEFAEKLVDLTLDAEQIICREVGSLGFYVTPELRVQTIQNMLKWCFVDGPSGQEYPLRRISAPYIHEPVFHPTKVDLFNEHHNVNKSSERLTYAEVKAEQARRWLSAVAKCRSTGKAPVVRCLVNCNRTAKPFDFHSLGVLLSGEALVIMHLHFDGQLIGDTLSQIRDESDSADIVGVRVPLEELDLFAGMCTGELVWQFWHPGQEGLGIGKWPGHVVVHFDTTNSSAFEEFVSAQASERNISIYDIELRGGLMVIGAVSAGSSVHWLMALPKNFEISFAVRLAEKLSENIYKEAPPLSEEVLRKLTLCAKAFYG
jgi:hypothetical protein